MKSKLPTAKGRVIEALTNTQFIVEFDKVAPSQHFQDTMRCYMGGKMRKNLIFVRVGDYVEVELAGDNLGRIVYRGRR